MTTTQTITIKYSGRDATYTRQSRTVTTDDLRGFVLRRFRNGWHRLVVNVGDQQVAGIRVNSDNQRTWWIGSESGTEVPS